MGWSALFAAAIAGNPGTFNWKSIIISQVVSPSSNGEQPRVIAHIFKAVYFFHKMSASPIKLFSFDYQNPIDCQRGQPCNEDWLPIHMFISMV